MITGLVTSFYQATIRLIVRGPTGQAQEVEAVIDTGFDGALSLPSADIAALGLPWRRRLPPASTPASLPLPAVAQAQRLVSEKNVSSQ
jgi:predicted aspartyl protease